VRLLSAARKSRFRRLVALVGLAAPGLPWACGTKEQPAGRGADCYRIEDCREGLVCVKNVCTNDLGDIAGMPPPMGAAGVTGGADAGVAGSAGTAGGTNKTRKKEGRVKKKDGKDKIK